MSHQKSFDVVCWTPRMNIFDFLELIDMKTANGWIFLDSIRFNLECRWLVFGREDS